MHLCCRRLSLSGNLSINPAHKNLAPRSPCIIPTFQLTMRKKRDHTGKKGKGRFIFLNALCQYDCMIPTNPCPGQQKKADSPLGTYLPASHPPRNFPRRRTLYGTCIGSKPHSRNGFFYLILVGGGGGWQSNNIISPALTRAFWMWGYICMYVLVK